MDTQQQDAPEEERLDGLALQEELQDAATKSKLSSIILNKVKYDSYCDATVVAAAKVRAKSVAISVFSLGLAYPWALCTTYKAQIGHHVVCGKRMKFIGDPKELFSHWLFWWFLTVVTIGFYSLVVHTRMDQWKAANTVFEDTEVIEDDAPAERVVNDAIAHEKEEKKDVDAGQVLNTAAADSDETTAVGAAAAGGAATPVGATLAGGAATPAGERESAKR